MEFFLSTMSAGDFLDKQTVETKLAEYRAWFENGLPKYEYEVTPESYQQAKSDVTKLNKLVKLSSAERQRIKKALLENFEDANKQILELEKMATAAADGLKSQIKVFDDADKAKKKEVLKNLFAERHGTKYDFDLVFDPRWLNKTITTGEIYSGMQAAFDHLELAYKELESVLDTSIGAQIILKNFCKDGDKQEAFRQWGVLQKQIKQVHEAEQRPEPVKEPEVILTGKDQVQIEIKKEPEELLTFRCDLTGTKEQHSMMGAYLKEIGMTVKVIKDDKKKEKKDE